MSSRVSEQACSTRTGDILWIQRVLKSYWCLCSNSKMLLKHFKMSFRLFCEFLWVWKRKTMMLVGACQPWFHKWWSIKWFNDWKYAHTCRSMQLGDVHRIQMTFHNIPDHLCPSNLLVKFVQLWLATSALATRPRSCASIVRQRSTQRVRWRVVHSMRG